MKRTDLCNATTTDKTLCPHVCGNAKGHGGKHLCRLCPFCWKGGAPVREQSIEGRNGNQHPRVPEHTSGDKPPSAPFYPPDAPVSELMRRKEREW